MTNGSTESQVSAPECDTNMISWHADDRMKLSKAEALDLVSRQSGGQRKIDFIQVISAFEIPHIRYDPIRKAFYRHESPCNLFADAVVSCACFASYIHALGCRFITKHITSRVKHT